MHNARNIAAGLLDKIQSGRHNLDQLLLQADSQIMRLNRPDRGLFHALVYGILRWQARLDWIIDGLASRPGKRIDPLVRIILRMGLFQILFLERIPVSAAVNTSVELSKKNRRKWAAGFINSLLRRGAEQGDNIKWPDREKDPETFLSVYYSFPKWLISRWLNRWGVDNTDNLCQSINAIPVITIRTNTLRTTRQHLLADVKNEVNSANITPESPEGIYFSSLRRPFVEWPTFQKGWFQVQSEAAQCISHLLSVHPKNYVWDACAGLGTKTAHIAQLMENQGKIVASDTSKNKLKRLAIEMERLGIGNIQSKQIDLSQTTNKHHSGIYDRILVDAPCTGLGVLQKNPDGKWRTAHKDIQSNSRRQLQLLGNAASYLKPNGLLVYAVCSFEPEENEHVIQGFLQKHPEFVINRPKLRQMPNGASFLTSEGFFKTLPHLHHMDGFFAAVLRKRN